MTAKLKTIHVACGQIVCIPGDLAGNLRQIKQLSVEAAVAGVRFVLFAEGALTGYVLTQNFLKKHAISADSRPVRELQALSRKLRIVIAAGAVEQTAAGGM